MTWAVSQAAPLRNVEVVNDLLFFEYVAGDAAGYASGGWVSGADVGGAVSFGSQQQFMVRSSKASSFDMPVWNGVFAGTEGAPSAQCGSSGDDVSQPSISVQASVPLVAEKPYVRYEDGGKFSLVIPSAEKDVVGVPTNNNATVVGFESVYVATSSDSAKTINAKLASGLHVILSPGIYDLEDSIAITNADTVLLGLGFATLISPSNGEPCIMVGDVDGVRVAGVLLEAGAWSTKGAMLQVGETGTFAGCESNPTVLSDVFARVGGPSTGVGPVETMFLIQNGYTIIDNTWLWRADHYQNPDGSGNDLLVKNFDNTVKNGVVVTADNVFAYGLAAEHTTEDNVIWSGDAGTVFFYQAEINYDTTSDVWDHSCFVVGEGVTSFYGTGLGCYSYFRDHVAVAEKGIDTGGNSAVIIDKAVSVWLNGMDGSSIKNVIDADGLNVDETNHVAYSC